MITSAEEVVLIYTHILHGQGEGKKNFAVTSYVRSNWFGCYKYSGFYLLVNWGFKQFEYYLN